ncbi:electron transfer flavoprotein beta subunit lysine methyltransferase-like isoform X3 [Sipha flava]|uniref:ETFB lysine methyltransferase n=1 Tax=Sipha flava TaxID=143950 RepID=A0A8B8FC77_9HEMI|nr:electron transfer flavoprotein beta subunit lysine methyltransferase-like isoform X3 [Sipha flava]
MNLRCQKIKNYAKTVFNSYCSSNELLYATQIKNTTTVCTNHLTPEIKLYLINDQCKLWHLPVDQCPFNDPFWAFYWPGGQAISRFILDNYQYVKNKTVLDVGSGSAACSLASAMAGANEVTANDIDPVACVAAKLNAQLNGVKINILSKNILFDDCSNWDVIIVGDMFYSNDIADVLWKWLDSLRVCGKTILIGDPGTIAD